MRHGRVEELTRHRQQGGDLLGQVPRDDDVGGPEEGGGECQLQEGGQREKRAEGGARRQVGLPVVRGHGVYHDGLLGMLSPAVVGREVTGGEAGFPQ